MSTSQLSNSEHPLSLPPTFATKFPQAIEANQVHVHLHRSANLFFPHPLSTFQPITTTKRCIAMSSYVHHPALPMLRPLPRASPPPPIPQRPPSLHLAHLHPYQHPPPPQPQPQPQPHIDPLDLLSRVALGQYPIPIEQERPASPTWHQPPHLELYTRRPPKRTLEPSPPSSVHDARYHHVEHAQPSPAAFSHPTIPPPYPPMPRARRERDVFVSDFSPVSSDDGMPSSSGQSRGSNQPVEQSGRLSKVMRTARDSDVHKPRSQPSRFCHICSRTSKKVGLVACGNFTTGACRKVICQKCFTE